MRINKFLSGAGIVSRRGADQWIADGRVKINGQLAELGSKVEAGDQVEVDGKLVEQEEQLVYIALNKPVGITSTTERHIEGNVVDFVNHPLRIFHIGRLDKDSDGLLLLTNDGDIVNEILREEHGHEKEYIVTVDSPLTASFISQMENGVKILDTVTKPCTVKKLGPKTFSIILTQGLNRQIRRMCAALGYHIRRLQRVRILTIELGDLPIGEWRELTDTERDKLFKTLQYEPKR
ncbi:23S rRNA pseudouridine synthase F [Sporosarcina sp. P21c]|uniref:pseudouridine synthase n=1 Tax=Sporosarcina TaxID=1569 RepID=UPI000A150F5A|nr:MULTISPECIES: pseudouridine synthase [Sporosarcina]ARJ38864.1 23S rRNA pseudouridine synthase F [Sporosarcina ureae]PIC68297.1 23S rRNA pseudouridine synthase F [Sporosarcina sp. P16a]PIC84122.1 23S rRNA pseudouridine synthase F [Sporosarcina sp. P1]PIC90508.1 23S rRNA pseudouridine synthase F [Sporosarcina sp. P21c]PIC94039.1 23S rRNA pseudouridine synthase F [Sporosarcina sp. P25]